MEKKCFIAGLPGVGKTTYIAALWDIIMRQAQRLSLEFTTTPDDMTYLNDIREYWMRMRVIERSKIPAPSYIKMNLIRISDNQKMVLNMPDFMGEQYQRIIDHTLADSIKEWINTADGMLFFIDKLEEDASKDDLEEDDYEEQIADRNQEKQDALALTVDRMMITSQNLMVLKYIWANAPKIRKLAICISSWDKKSQEGFSPEGYLENRSPVLYHFIKYHFRNVVYYGVSAQGFDYNNLNDKKEEMTQKTQNSIRAFIIDEKGQDSPDLTIPLNYLFS